MDSSVAVDLPELKAHLDAWRGSHRQRARIPDHFYSAAVRLLDRYSVSIICRETRLRPASLRKHAAPPQTVETSPTKPSSSFLRITAADLVSRPLSSEAQRLASAAANSSSRVMFERADGSRLTLHLSSADPQHLEALCVTLLRS